MALWAVLVGGTALGMRLEVHDILFAQGDSIEDCIPSLRAQWRGVPASLHLDAWGRLDAADGHALALSDAPPEGSRVWFVHTGGYARDRFAELHDNHFVVARDAAAAKARALAAAKGWHLQHKDALFDVDSVLDLTEAAGPRRYLVPTPRAGAAFAFQADYVPIG